MKRISLGFIGIAALALGCGGGGSISLTDLGDQFEKDFCGQQVSCGAYPDIATCREVVESDTAQLEASVEAGRASYDADKAGECVDAIVASSSCEPVVNVGSSPTTTACDEMISGNVAVGDECFVDEECADNGECEQECGADACCAGTCAATDPEPALVAIGGDCSDADCVSGAWCNQDDSGSTCDALGAEGDACVGFSGCGPDLACNGFSGAGTCFRPGKEGGACDTSLSFACARSDNYCDIETEVCAKRLGAGESCGSEGPPCALYATCIDATCVQDPGLGDSCEVDGDIRCLGNADCMDGTCKLDGPDKICS